MVATSVVGECTWVRSADSVVVIEEPEYEEKEKEVGIYSKNLSVHNI